jgi:hypothetical protein
MMEGEYGHFIFVIVGILCVTLPARCHLLEKLIKVLPETFGQDTWLSEQRK